MFRRSDIPSSMDSASSSRRSTIRRPIKSVAIKPLPQLELLTKVSQLNTSFLTSQPVKESLIND
jgi:hypothetical protein